MKLIKLKYREAESIESDLIFDKAELSHLRNSTVDSSHCRLTLKDGHTYAIPMSAEDVIKEIKSQLDL